MSADLPKQELLIKLMGMTGSSSDGEALVAIRKANDLLRAAGWDWEKVLRGKIKVVENPFIGANPFEDRGRVVKPQPAPQPARQPVPQPDPFQPNPYQPKPAPPPAAYWASSTSPLSRQRNKFANFCYCCGVDTPANVGWLFDPWNYVKAATSKWQVACDRCNVGVGNAVRHYAATPIRNKKKASISDLS